MGASQLVQCNEGKAEIFRDRYPLNEFLQNRTTIREMTIFLMFYGVAIGIKYIM